MGCIPVVDLSNLDSNYVPDCVVKELDQAFSTVGFVYLKNHGISEEKVSCQVDQIRKFNETF